MTTQEFVKKHVDEMFLNIYPVAPESNAELRIQDEYSYGLKMGLSVGLDIADEFGDWTLYNNWEKHSNGKWMNDDFLTIPTTSELITIFLTEKYGNNG